MKTNRSNSFRLHRITKTNSLRKTDGSQHYTGDDTFKLQAIHSINKGVKYNDLSFITGRDHLNKLRKEPLVEADLAVGSAHNNLMDMRKKYDDMKKQCLNKETTIFQLKEEKQRYELKQGQFDGGKMTGRNKVENLENQVDQKRLLLDQTQVQKKVLLGIRQRHKLDKVFYDQRKFDLQQEISHYKKQLKIFDKQGVQLGENTDRTTKIYEKLVNQIQSEKRQRQSHLQSIEGLLDTKANLLQVNDMRGIQIQQIAQRAMLDKNLSEKQWQKIFFTHVFMNKMLRNKIQREMQKFKVVEFAFKQIKTATGVNDSQTLVQKYLSKEHVYGELLGKISENQKTIEHLKTQTQKLHIEEKTLQAEKQILQSTKVVHQDLHDYLKSLSHYQEKALSAELFQTKIGNWITKQLKKFEYFDKSAKKIQVPKKKSEIISMIEQYSQKLSLSLQIANQLKVSQQSSNLPSTPSQPERLIRIVARKSIVSSKGEQLYDIDEQQTTITNLNDQVDIIANQRDQVLKNNQKFMKEMKRKRQEMKKVLIQALDRKEKEKEKPKLPELKKDE